MMDLPIVDRETDAKVLGRADSANAAKETAQRRLAEMNEPSVVHTVRRGRATLNLDPDVNPPEVTAPGREVTAWIVDLAGPSA
jgi:hypothetical protein